MRQAELLNICKALRALLTTSANQEDVLELAGVDGVNHLPSHTQDCMVTKPDCEAGLGLAGSPIPWCCSPPTPSGGRPQGAGHIALVPPRQLQGTLDDRGEVTVAHVRHIGKTSLKARR
jgi:hypothetical protein